MPRNTQDFEGARRTPLRWEDLTGTQQKGVAKEISRIGKGTRTNVTETIATNERLAETSSTAAGRKKASHKAQAMREVEPHLRDKPITLKGATQRRIDSVHRAVDHAREHGEALPGAGWYFQHRDQIMSGAEGFDAHTASAAAAALSPGKDPKQDELPAVHGLMELHRGDHTITANGQTRKVSDIPSQELSDLVTTAKAERAAEARGSTAPRTVTSSMDDLHVAGRAHAHSTHKAIKTLRGEVAPERANDPVTGPKTASYARAIHHSESGTPEHLDYMGIAHHMAHGDPNQGMLQYSRPVPGERISQDSPLSPDHDTAEDTWMQAISSGQKAHAVGSNSTGNARHYSPAKRAVDGPADPNKLLARPAGIAGDTSISRQGAAHAFNNKATRDAAKALSPVSHNQHGEAIDVPSILVQEVAWTQFRRDAHGDAPFNRQQAARAAEKRGPKIVNHPTLPGLG